MIYEFNGYIPVVHPSSFIHPQAAVTGNVIIGENVYVGPGAAIRGDWGEIIIENGCNIQENCTVHMFPGTTVLLKEGAHLGRGRPGLPASQIAAADPGGGTASLLAGIHSYVRNRGCDGARAGQSTAL